jgi:hypothetical protein
MQSAKSGVSRVPGLPAKLISAPEASIRSCHVLTVTLARAFIYEEPECKRISISRDEMRKHYDRTHD